jgi:hypothetical protein
MDAASKRLLYSIIGAPSSVDTKCSKMNSQKDLEKRNQRKETALSFEIDDNMTKTSRRKLSKYVQRKIDAAVPLTTSVATPITNSKRRSSIINQSGSVPSRPVKEKTCTSRKATKHTEVCGKQQLQRRQGATFTLQVLSIVLFYLLIADLKISFVI